MVATFAQGLVLGTFVQGIPVAGRTYAGGSFDWATPFALLSGAGLVAGYAMIVAPLLAAMALFVMCYLGLAISIWPMLVPYTISHWAAASATKSQAFLGIGTMFLLPIIVMYTGWSYWVFRGKVKADAGYH